MAELFRDAPLGQLIRLLTRNELLQYPEEMFSFNCPEYYEDSRKAGEAGGNGDCMTNEANRADLSSEEPDLERSVPAPDDEIIEHEIAVNRQRTSTQPFTEERLKFERRMMIERTKSLPVGPSTMADGTILVDWYTTDDPANPQNWSHGKKGLVALQIDLYTFVVYCGSSIYVSSELGVIAHFGVTQTDASLGLALYVLGYGIGPLIFAPMSEIAIFGRNVPYVATFVAYMILCIPTALANNLPGLLVLRFLQGFFGSPCLANGGATMQDMYSLLYLPYSMSFWVAAMFAAPALGPMLSGFAVSAENWRWSIWEILWMTAPVFVFWSCCLPETSTSTILLHRARRLRKLTKNQNIRSQTEIDQRGRTFKDVAMDAIVKPFEIMLKDPAILFANVYTALTYGIYYSFFEVFPLVYGQIYGFNLGETGIVFLAIVVGCVIAIGIYFSYLHFLLIHDIEKNGIRSPEWRLRPALSAVFVFTMSLFAFGWLANNHIHWIAGVIFLTIYSTAIYIILQCLFVYVPMSYPQYAASLFAGNDFCRSAFAFAAVLFSRPMYLRLGIGQGISLLAGLSTLGIIGVWLLYLYGHKLRARSKFAVG